MDTRTAVKFGKQGRFHLGQAVEGSSLFKTACGAVRDTKVHTTQGMVSEVGSAMCTECLKAKPAAPAKPTKVYDLSAYAAVVAEASERVGWWGPEVERHVFAARMYAAQGR